MFNLPFLAIQQNYKEYEKYDLPNYVPDPVNGQHIDLFTGTGASFYGSYFTEKHLDNQSADET
jgi:hypothetical protein